jgi:hypothetical protein
MERLWQTPTDSAPFTVSIGADRTFETVVSLRFIFLVFESSSSPISVLDYRVSRQDASLILTPLSGQSSISLSSSNSDVLSK